jgi:hypothetical protein
MFLTNKSCSVGVKGNYMDQLHIWTFTNNIIYNTKHIKINFFLYKCQINFTNCSKHEKKHKLS